MRALSSSVNMPRPNSLNLFSITPEATKLVMTLLRSLAASLDVSSAPDCSNRLTVWSK